MRCIITEFNHAQKWKYGSDPQPMAQATTDQTESSDILSASLWKAIPAFAFPVAATSILEQLSNLIATVVIGQLSGPNGTMGMAAVGSNTPITSLVLNLFIGISLGANVVIANAIGRQDQRTVSRAVHTSILMALAGVIVTIAGEIFAEPLLTLLNVPTETLPLAALYLRIYLIGMPAILLYNFESAILRSVGETQLPLHALMISTVLSVLLDLLFVPVLGWGVAGVGIATVISYSTSALILFIRLLRIDSPVRVHIHELSLDGAVLRRIVRIGLPAGVQSAVFALANIIIQAAINSLGTEVMAASSAAMSLEYVFYNLLNSFSQACTTFVGQNNGARNIVRCKRTLKVCLIEDGVVAAITIAGVVFFGRSLLALFNGDPKIVAIGYIRVCSIFPAYVFSMCYENVSGYMRGFGISLLPALLTMLGVCGIRFYWIAQVFPVHHTFRALMLVYPISLCATTLLVVGACIIVNPARSASRAIARTR
jgi:putative MATE family efflux protein